uniref:PLA2c domain-containing protein n=1 Tax=Timema tahoe TaxID=61484 RepID=A0A7R9FGJ7_9NEOP|nr:unnamed protein product [Timema tahoe]
MRRACSPVSPTSPPSRAPPGKLVCMRRACSPASPTSPPSRAPPDRTSDVVPRYLSDLYSHPEFPTKSPGDLQPELQRKVTGGWKKVLCPKRMFRYLKAIHRKHKTGQPVSFTDLFGHMVGDLLLGERKTCTLSEQSAKLTRGELPLPMYTCLQVKKDVSARVYQVRSDDQPQQGDSLGVHSHVLRYEFSH